MHGNGTTKSEGKTEPVKDAEKPDAEKSEFLKAMDKASARWLIYVIMRKKGGPKWACYAVLIMLSRLDQVVDPIDQEKLKAEIHAFMKKHFAGITK